MKTGKNVPRNAIMMATVIINKTGSDRIRIL